MLLWVVRESLSRLPALETHNRHEFARVRHVSEQFPRDVARCLWLQGTLPVLMQGYNSILFTGPRLVRGNGHEHLRRLFLLSSSSVPACLQRRKLGSIYGSSGVSGSISSSRSLAIGETSHFWRSFSQERKAA